MTKKRWVVIGGDSTDLPPCTDRLKRMRIAHRDCLAHVDRLLTITSSRECSEWRVVMGLRRLLPGCLALHAWLEYKDVVVDLITPEKFFDRAYYYEREGIIGVEVKRYSEKEVLKFIVADKEIGFWGFEDRFELEVRQEGTIEREGP